MSQASSKQRVARDANDFHRKILRKNVTQLAQGFPNAR
jgi:hypothetical protein